MDPAAVMASQTYRGFAPRIPLPARETSISMHSSCGWRGSLLKNCKARNTRRYATEAVASDLVSRRIIQAQINAQRSDTAAEAIRTVLWFRTVPVTEDRKSTRLNSSH